MKRILIIDDVATNLICASEVLKDDYEVSMAKSGKQGLLMLKEMTPDLILLDINMPQMNGYEVLQKIKENPKLSDIPVVFLTAVTDRENEVKGLKMGAMDFIKKPYEPDVMKSRIDKILQHTTETKELKDIANTDSLTKLSNRRVLEEKLSSADIENESGYFLLLDLDNFKKVNDTYGHLIGDAVLVRLAKILEEEISSEDYTCRLGGDEFAVFLFGEHEKNDIRNMMRRIIAGCEYEIGELLSETDDFKVSVSVGIAKKPEDGNDFLSLYGAADKALYFVKQNGKRGYHFYRETEEANTNEEENLINLLQLQRLVSEKDNDSGAYKVEYGGFKKIYHFVSRCMERKNQDVQLVLFSLSSDEKNTFDDENNKYITSLEEAITKSLRRGDVATRCGNSQFIVILMDANDVNGEMVANRISGKYCDLISDDRVNITYHIQTVKNDL